MPELVEQVFDPNKAPPILVAIDFSADSKAALGWALEHAALISTNIIVLHVIHDPAENPGFYNRPGQSALLPIDEVATEKMDAFLANFSQEQKNSPPFMSIQKQFANGLPAGRIAEIAQQTKAQLIVIGTKGRAGLSNLLLGSVAENVLQIAKVPVVVLKADQDLDAELQNSSDHDPS